jgi:hypothetical protein
MFAQAAELHCDPGVPAGDQNAWFEIRLDEVEVAGATRRLVGGGVGS